MTARFFSLLLTAWLSLTLSPCHCRAQDRDYPSGIRPDWQRELYAQLPLLGQHNWIVIADAAYPWRSAAGIQTIVTTGDQLDVVRSVLEMLAHTPHVRPIVYTAAELPAVAENDARGVTAYRAALAVVLQGQGAVQSLPHEQILATLNEDAKSFHILVLKTKLTIPYGAVYLKLDSAYWNAEAERRLRDAMGR